MVRMSPRASVSRDAFEAVKSERATYTFPADHGTYARLYDDGLSGEPQVLDALGTPITFSITAASSAVVMFALYIYITMIIR